MSNSLVINSLPFRYPNGQEEKNQEFLEKVIGICGNNWKQAYYYLTNSVYACIFDPENFKLVYDAHIDALKRAIAGAFRAISREEADELFVRQAKTTFEKLTGRKAWRNTEAFRLFLSLLRRYDNIQAHKRYLEERSVVRSIKRQTSLGAGFFG